MSVNAFAIGGTFEVRSHSTLLPIIFHCLQRGRFCPEALRAAQYVLRVLLQNAQHVQNANNTRITHRTRRTRSTAF